MRYCDMASQLQGSSRESRHLWVGGLPDGITEVGLKDYFSKFGKIEGVKILPQKYPNIGVAAFIDFHDVKSAVEARDTKHKLGGNELRTNFKAKTTEKFDSKRTVIDVPERASKDQTQSRGSTSSCSSESDTDDASSSTSTSSDQNTNGRNKKKKCADVKTSFLKVTGLANRPERILQDGLYYEFCRYSPHVVVKMYGDTPEKRSAVVKYNSFESCHEAYMHSQGMVLFGSKLKLFPLNVDEFPSGGRDLPSVSHANRSPFADIDPQATRSLFVGNIPKNISIYELRDIFQRFGNVLDVEIKKMGGNATYGFVLYYDLVHAIHAKQCMDGQNVKGNNIRVGFGKGTPSKTLWIDGIDPHTSEAQLERQIVKYGKVVRLGIDPPRCCAMVQYDNADSAKDALNSLKGSFIGNSKRLMTDFANRDARAAFFSCVGDGEVSGSTHSYPGPSSMFAPAGMIAHRSGMMMPRGGIPMVGVGRARYAFANPPVNYYFNPYMEESADVYGHQRPPFHRERGMRRYGPQGPGEFSQGMDYEEELRAFSRKREWERERERHIKRHSASPSDSDNERSQQSGSLVKKNKKDVHTSSDIKGSSLNDSHDETHNNSDSDENHENARRKATQRARKHRDKNRKTESQSVSNEDCSNSGEVASHDKSKQQRAIQVQESIPSLTEKESSECVEDVEREGKDVNPVFSSATPPNIDASVDSCEETIASYNITEKECSRQSATRNDVIDTSTDNVQHSTLESPLSPIVAIKDNQKFKVESDLSSDEEFKDMDLPDDTPKTVMLGSRQDNVTSGPRTPEPISKESSFHKPKQELSKKLRPLPRRYQIEESVEAKKQEIHEQTLPLRGVKRYHPAPRSPSPHGHHRKRCHSPSSDYVVNKRSYPRGRHSSPTIHTPRHLSRSPLGYSGSPTHRRYSTSPLSPRIRSPVPQHRGRSPIPQSRSRDRGLQRHRFDSPPFDGIRGKCGRRSSPPYSRYPYSPSPPRPRSPAGNRCGRRRSRSFSPPQQCPSQLKRRERSPGSGSSRLLPHISADDCQPTSKQHGKRPLFSRTPSPEPRYHEFGKDVIPGTKRQKISEDVGPKSPANSPYSSPPPPSSRDEEKSDRPAKRLSKPTIHRGSDTSWLKSADDTPDNKSLEVQSESGLEASSDVETQPVSNLLDLLRKYPVMWQGHLTLKNDLAAVQLHFLSGNAELAKLSLPLGSNQVTPTLRIAQRMRLEKSQLDGVERRIQSDDEHCLLLALPCGRDPSDVQEQTQTLKNNLISYLLQKQAAGIINVQGPQGSPGYVLHIFPPCPFTESHLLRVAPDLSSASDNCHLMIIAAIM